MSKRPKSSRDTTTEVVQYNFHAGHSNLAGGPTKGNKA